MKLGFITDEVTQSFDEAVRFAKELGLAGLELRSVEDTPIDAVPPATLRGWSERLNREGLAVCGLASSFYKCGTGTDEIENEMKKLERLCDAAEILGCVAIRGFAFFAPESGPLPAGELAAFFERPARLMEQRGKTLLLEADPSVNTSNHAALAALIKAIACPNIRAIFDPGNCLYDPLGEVPYPGGYEAIHPYIAHIHVKDAVRAVPESYCVKVGTGEVDYPALLRRLGQDGYEGWLSMETHYRSGGQLSDEQMRLPGGADFSRGGAAATAESLAALKAMMQEAGLL